eukprot:m.51132 g.51132  ORF g.51132 m.51132 type:complete len:934 (+) comp6282_c0_seq1:31-2832(+)
MRVQAAFLLLALALAHARADEIMPEIASVNGSIVVQLAGAGAMTDMYVVSADGSDSVGILDLADAVDSVSAAVAATAGFTFTASQSSATGIVSTAVAALATQTGATLSAALAAITSTALGAQTYTDQATAQAVSTALAAAASATASSVSSAIATSASSATLLASTAAAATLASALSASAAALVAGLSATSVAQSTAIAAGVSAAAAAVDSITPYFSVANAPLSCSDLSNQYGSYPLADGLYNIYVTSPTPSGITLPQSKAYCENSLVNTDFSNCMALGAGILPSLHYVRYCEALLGISLNSFRTGNIALNKPASQSSYLGNNSASYPSSRAVDGSASTVFTANSCVHGRDWPAADTDGWFMVDLMDYYIIERIDILNRGDCCNHRINPYQLRIGNISANGGWNNSECVPGGQFSAGSGELASTYCSNLTPARYVSINFPGRRAWNFCEILVYGFPGTISLGQAVLTATISSPAGWTTILSNLPNTSFTVPLSTQYSQDPPTPINPGALQTYMQRDLKTVATEMYVEATDGSWFYYRISEFSGPLVLDPTIANTNLAMTGLAGKRGIILGNNYPVATNNQVGRVCPLSGFSYTGAAQSYVVPAGVTSIFVRLWGAGGGAGNSLGGAQGGAGGYLETVVNVTAGETISVYVGGGGASYTATSGGSGGYNGGGAGTTGTVSTFNGGGGGGRSDIRRGTTSLAAAGGGGGGGSSIKNATNVGGAGGGLSARYGCNIGQSLVYPPVMSLPGGGGTQSAGGLAGRQTVSSQPGTNEGAGIAGTGGNGGTGLAQGSGGGGGGWFGGGGGVAGSNTAGAGNEAAGGGGGGSSYGPPGPYTLQYQGFFAQAPNVYPQTAPAYTIGIGGTGLGVNGGHGYIEIIPSKCRATVPSTPGSSRASATVFDWEATGQEAVQPACHASFGLGAAMTSSSNIGVRVLIK